MASTHRGAQVITVNIDNINTDMTEDIQRALPSAIAAFGHDTQSPDIRVQVREHDLIPHDTGFIPYLVVSALVLATLVIAGILAAMVVAREFESGTASLCSGYRRRRFSSPCWAACWRPCSSRCWPSALPPGWWSSATA